VNLNLNKPITTVQCSNEITTTIINMGRKFRGMGAHLTQSRLGWGLSPCQVYHLDPYSRLATINMGRKLGGSAPFLGRGAGSPSNTKLPGPRPSSIPSGILIHAAIWPQQIWTEYWGLCPFGEGKLGPHLTQCGHGRGLPACQVSSWSVQPFGTIHQRHRQDRQDNGPIT